MHLVRAALISDAYVLLQALSLGGAHPSVKLYGLYKGRTAIHGRAFAILDNIYKHLHMEEIRRNRNCGSILKATLTDLLEPCR